MSKTLLIALAFACTAAAAAQMDARTEFNRRAAQRDIELFRTLDRNADGALTREEAKGDLDLGPRFDDVDVNRDGVVTAQELQRYIEKQYQVEAQIPAR